MSFVKPNRPKLFRIKFPEVAVGLQRMNLSVSNKTRREKSRRLPSHQARLKPILRHLDMTPPEGEPSPLDLTYDLSQSWTGHTNNNIINTLKFCVIL